MGRGSRVGLESAGDLGVCVGVCGRRRPLARLGVHASGGGGAGSCWIQPLPSCRPRVAVGGALLLITLLFLIRVYLIGAQRAGGPWRGGEGLWLRGRVAW